MDIAHSTSLAQITGENSSLVFAPLEVSSHAMQASAGRVEINLAACQTQLEEQVPGLIRTNGELQNGLELAKSQFEALTMAHQTHVKALKQQIQFLNEANKPLQGRVSELETTAALLQKQIDSLMSYEGTKAALTQYLHGARR